MNRMEPLRNVEAGVLDIAYQEAGPAEGPPVFLMHGFPYDIHAFAEVVPVLAQAGLPRHRAVPARLRPHPLPAR
jgi:pimeloyl-ACP methyl ester carboxylesterase